MDGKNPLMTFEEYREQELRWYWYSLPEGSSEAEREAFSARVEQQISAAWQARQRARDPLRQRMMELAWQHCHVEGQGDDF